MVSLAHIRLRLLLALLIAFAFVSGTAVAQNDDGVEEAPVEEAPVEEGPVEETADEETAPEDGDGGDGLADDSAKKKKKKRKKGEDELPLCEPEKSEEPDDESAENKPEPEPQPECQPPPRCEGAEIDLAPDEDIPNCIDQSRLNRLIGEFEAAAAEEARTLEELSEALGQLGELNAQLAALQVRLGEVQLRLASARADAGFAAVRQAIAGESLDDVSAALAAEEDQLRRQAVEAYMGGGEIALATTAVVSGLESYSDVETAREYAEAIINSQLTTIDQVDALRVAVVSLGEVVAAIELAADADAERVSVIEAQVDALIVQQRELVAEAELETEAIAQRIAAIQERKQAYAEELRITGAGGGAIGEMLRNRQADQDPPTDPFGTLAMPLARTRLGSPFGPRVHPIFSDTRLHTGIDMSGGSGDRIVASADGVVVYAEETSGYGNVVVVDHGNTIATLYAHMSADAVWVGLEVVEGDLLGFVGSTGFSTGPHLHYEVRVAGQPVDPTPYLDFS